MGKDIKYSWFQLIKKYLHYYIRADNSKGHGVHSPFVFEFIQQVLNKDFVPLNAAGIEALRKQLKKENATVEVIDYGTGITSKRSIAQIATATLKPRKYAALLYRIAVYYNRKNILELGTSLGITTAWLCGGNAAVHSIEGAPAIAALARQHLSQLNCTATIVEGNIDDVLPALLLQVKPDMVFIDGNHRELPTLHYFNKLLESADEDTLFIFDDIHWSEGMEAAWRCIKQHAAVTLTIDLFFVGIVLCRKEFKEKQHFCIRF